MPRRCVTKKFCFVVNLSVFIQQTACKAGISPGVLRSTPAQLSWRAPVKLLVSKRPHVPLGSFNDEHISCADSPTASRRSAQDQLPGLGAKQVGVVEEVLILTAAGQLKLLSSTMVCVLCLIVHTLLPISFQHDSNCMLCCAA